MPEFRKWKSINKFSDAYAKAQKFGVKEFVYRGKIKLHGTNSGIHIENGEVYPQKRTDFITVDNDNCGFAKFVSGLDIFDKKQNIIVYGEWAGPGVQKTDAVTQLSTKAFFVFSVYDLMTGQTIFEPTEIRDLLEPVFGDDFKEQEIYVLPWQAEEIEIDFSNQKDCQRFVDNIMKKVDGVISKEDPYIKSVFDVSGPGEGLVMYPIEGRLIDGTELTHDIVFDYIFKAKTEAHSVQKTKKRNHVAPERPEGIDDFIEMFYTEQRFEQMLVEIGGEATRAKTGEFLKAVMSDVHKESKEEIALASFEWKDVPKYAAPVVKTWWFKKCDKL